MKNSTASNIAVSLATALAETIAEYEGQTRELKSGMEAFGRQLKQLTDERVKVVSIVDAIHHKLLDRLISLPDEAEERVFLHQVLNQLSAIPWPLPIPNLIKSPQAG